MWSISSYVYAAVTQILHLVPSKEVAGKPTTVTARPSDRHNSENDLNLPAYLTNTGYIVEQ